MELCKCVWSKIWYLSAKMCHLNKDRIMLTVANWGLIKATSDGGTVRKSEKSKQQKRCEMVPLFLEEGW
jgi:hypothetical protein